MPPDARCASRPPNEAECPVRNRGLDRLDAGLLTVQGIPAPFAIVSPVEAVTTAVHGGRSDREGEWAAHHRVEEIRWLS